MFVNDVGRSALLEAKNPQFPVGSIIVREKLLKIDDAVPQLLVAMIKRARGFNRKANDWEFLMIDGSLTKITQREKTGSCRDCHKQQKGDDFVFRTYMLKAAQVGLKPVAP